MPLRWPRRSCVRFVHVGAEEGGELQLAQLLQSEPG